MGRRAAIITGGVAAIFLLACATTAMTADVLRPAVTRGEQLRALVQLQELPAVAAEAGALATARETLHQASDALWQLLLAQSGDADHAFRWTPANRRVIEDAKARFRGAKAATVARTEALADAAAASPELGPQTAHCKVEQARCLKTWDAFACAPLLPVCLAAGF